MELSNRIDKLVNDFGWNFFKAFESYDKETPEQIRLKNEAKAELLALIREEGIQKLQWALKDYNMHDTDTAKNLQGYINDLTELTTHKDIDPDDIKIPDSTGGD